MRKIILLAVSFLVVACARSPETRREAAARESAVKSEAVRGFDEKIDVVDQRMAAIQTEIQAAEKEEPRSSGGAALRRELSTLRLQRDYLQSKKNHALLNPAIAE